MIAAKDNPFATGRVEALLPYDPRWIGESWEAIDARLERSGGRGAVIGPHGSGKTVFLETLNRRLKGDGVGTEHIFVNRESRSSDLVERVGAVPDDAVLLFDGAEQVGRRRWRQILRGSTRLRGLIATAHRSPGLPALIETRSTPEILLRCLRIVGGEDGFGEDDAERLFRRHRGNIRHALLDCYDVAAKGAVRVGG